MKGKSMRKYVLAITVFLSAAALSADKPPFKIGLKEPRIEARFEAKIRDVAPGEKHKVWIFFTDKEIFDEASLKTAVGRLHQRFTERAMKRRMNRAPDARDFDFYDIPVSENYVRELESIGMEVLRRSRWLNAVSARGNYELIKTVSELPFVSEIRPVARAVRKPLPIDPDMEGVFPPDVNKLYKRLPDSVADWYGQSFTQLNQINVPVVHQLGYTGQGVLIGQFDTGFDLEHPAFSSLNLIDKYDFINNDTSVGDALPVGNQPDHGTKTLSLTGGRADDTLIGAAYNADFILAKTEDLSQEVQAEEDNWVAAAEWADSLGADIITSSLGYFDWYSYSDLDGQTAVITVAAELAVLRGIAVFSSAGNERNKLFYYITPPADGPSVMAIGAVDSAGDLAVFSSAGPTYDGRIKPDLVAMGVGSFVAYNVADSYTFGSGTSFSCPLAAGAAALLLEAHPDWSPLDLRESMLRSADRFDNPDNLYGYGLLDTYRALNYLRIDPLDPIILAVGDSLDMDITVSSIENTPPITLTAENLPLSAQFTDLGDGTANLKYEGISEDVGSRTVQFTATAGQTSETLEVFFTVLADREITIGPNPFTDSLTVFLGTDRGRLEEISVYSVSGEKVWDNYTDTYNSETGTIVWRGVNNYGSKVSSGVYLVLIRTDRTVERVKVFRK